MHKNIKIFVSHRIDIDSFKIELPIYVNVLCGAYRPHQETGLLNDNTGDNISQKQPFYSELTVQYWAWKNQQADYYGLCHYRRYISFSNKRYKTSPSNFIRVPFLDKDSVKKYKLNDIKTIENLLNDYDCLLGEPSDVCNWIPSNGKKIPNDVFELWIAFENVYEKDVIILERIIDKLYPEYSLIYKEYFAGTKHRGFNCFIMKKEIFFEMCNFQFTILQEFEKIIDASKYTDENKRRVYGYMAEILFGIFTYKLQKEKKYRIKDLQLVYFYNTKKNICIKDRLICFIYKNYLIFTPIIKLIKLLRNKILSR